MLEHGRTIVNDLSTSFHLGRKANLDKAEYDP